MVFLNSDIFIAAWIVLPFILLVAGISLALYSFFTAKKNSKKVNLKILFFAAIVMVFALVRLNSRLVQGVNNSRDSGQVQK